MVYLQQIGDRLRVALFDSGIYDNIEAENFEAHRVEDVSRLARSVVMY